MQRRSLGCDAKYSVSSNHLIYGAAFVKLVLYPLKHAKWGATIRFRISCSIQPHKFYNQTFFIHTARRKFLAVLIKTYTAIIGNPAHGRSVFLFHGSFLQATKICANHSGTRNPIIISSKNQLAVFINEKGSAGRGCIQDGKIYNYKSEEVFHKLNI